MPSVAPGCWVYIDGYAQSAGSYGIPVLQRSTREVALLVAAHTVGALSPGHGRNDVVKFGNARAVGGSLDENFGRVIASAPPAPCTELVVDAAIVAPNSGMNLQREIRHQATLGSPRDLLTETSNSPIVVHKRGARTGLTSGLLDLDLTAHILDGQLGEECRYEDGFLIHGDTDSPFADEGDSGAIVIDDDDRVVGMVVGVLKHSRHAYCVPIVPILEALDVDLIGPG